jgi:hypothetical protein
MNDHAELLVGQVKVMKMGMAHFIPVVIFYYHGRIKWRQFNRWNRRTWQELRPYLYWLLGFLLSFLEILFF